MALHLYNMEICPFAQRTKMSLLEKGVPYEETFIDPRDKPDWFMEMNPKGKLPVVVHDGKLVRESAVVLEYLEDVFPEPSLVPDSAYGRAQMRLWLQFFNTEYLPAFYNCILTRKEGRAEVMRACIEELVSGLRELRGNGPYFMGEQLTLLDVSVAPFIERHPAVADLAGCPIPDGPEADPLHRWYAAMEARPCFQQTRRDADYWVRIYREYAEGEWGRTYFEANPGGD